MSWKGYQGLGLCSRSLGSSLVILRPGLFQPHHSCLRSFYSIPHTNARGSSTQTSLSWPLSRSSVSPWVLDIYWSIFLSHSWNHFSWDSSVWSACAWPPYLAPSSRKFHTDQASYGGVFPLCYFFLPIFCLGSQHPPFSSQFYCPQWRKGVPACGISAHILLCTLAWPITASPWQSVW